MEQNTYLYGASVQGIQSFIFKTNKLVDVIGASEIVEKICTNLYKKILADVKKENIIINAAGNIKLLLNEEQCQKIVREFPKKVMEYAPGITISQAVVKLENGTHVANAIEDLEKKLRTQRNKSAMPIEIGFMGTERYRKTDGIATFLTEDDKKYKKGEDFICEATLDKRKAAVDSFELFKKVTGITDDKIKEKITNQVEDLSIAENAFVAVIHADGNGLGQLVQSMGKALKDRDDAHVIFSKFSKELDEATKTAVQTACKSLGIDDEKWEKFPLRPVLLGGDDLTLIIQAQYAISFTKKFLEEFEKQTKEKLAFLKKDYKIELDGGLTACAGIAFVKDKYPLHYAMNLSEKLCKEAKKATGRKKSALSFYKVHDAFVEEMYKARERTDLSKESYTPYVIQENEDERNISQLQKVLGAFSSKSDDNQAVVSKLRQWISELDRDGATASFMLNRIQQMNKKFFTAIGTKEPQIIYDAMQIHALKS